jgi:CheY-like chemotaxis protein
MLRQLLKAADHNHALVNDQPLAPASDANLAMAGKVVLVVGGDSADQLSDSLRHAECQVLNVADGEAAINLAKHAAVDAFVLVSTGKLMGRTETALNLRDIRPSSEIILLARRQGKPSTSEAIARGIPNTHVLSRQELEDCLTLTEL